MLLVFSVVVVLDWLVCMMLNFSVLVMLVGIVRFSSVFVVWFVL